jgi:hypothetical protein
MADQYNSIEQSTTAVNGHPSQGKEQQTGRSSNTVAPTTTNPTATNAMVMVPFQTKSIVAPESQWELPFAPSRIRKREAAAATNNVRVSRSEIPTRSAPILQMPSPESQCAVS